MGAWLDSAHAEISANRIHDAFAFDQAANGHPIKMRLVWIPQKQRLDLNRLSAQLVLLKSAVSRISVPSGAVASISTDRGPSLGIAKNLEIARCSASMSGEMRNLSMKRGCARFEPHRLPNAAGRRVPSPLFADGLLVIIHRIFDANHERGMLIAVVAGFQARR